jgi:membrane-bound serine protease (ClpP class)
MVAALSMIFFLGVLSYAVKAQLSKIHTGKEGLIGETAVARTDVNGSGKVFLHGELWNATSDDHIAAGEQATVVEVRGMTLRVKKGG